MAQRTPEALKRLRGTDRPDRKPRPAKTQPAQSVPVYAPRGTSPAVRKVFYQLVSELAADPLCVDDASALVAVAEARHFRLQASAALQAEGVLRPDDRGRQAKSPLWQIWREAAEAERRGLASLNVILRDRRAALEAGTFDMIDRQQSLHEDVMRMIDHAN